MHIIRTVSTVVVLNGTSSSGKTALARAFQDRASAVFLNFSIDSILYTLPRLGLEALMRGEAVPNLPYQELDIAFYACVRELATLGRDLIVDNAVTSRAQAERLIAALSGHRVLMVSLWCSAEVLEQRERARGDRAPGLALRQRAQIDQWLDYDLRIDTSLLCPDAGAEQIADALERGSLKGFESTRRRLQCHS